MVCLVAALWVSAGTASGQPFSRIQSIGSLVSQGKLATSGADYISDDGKIVVGDSYTASGVRKVVRWTSAGGMVDTELASDVYRIESISGDGAFVVGTDIDQVPFRWSVAGGLEYLPFADESLPSAKVHGASADGSVVVGEGKLPDPNNRPGWYEPHPVRWVNGKVEVYDVLPGSAAGGSAEAVSANGSVIVGSCEVDSPAGGYVNRACRWTGLDELTDLGTLGGEGSDAWGVSADGNVVIGSAETAKGAYHSFYWTDETGMLDLTPGVPDSLPIAVSGDGKVVLGTNFDGRGEWIWSNGRLRFVKDLIFQSGLENEWPSLHPTDLSYDGSRISGWGQHVEDGVIRWTGAVISFDPDAGAVPRIRSEIREGDVRTVRVGALFEATFTASDVDKGDRLTVSATGLPPGAVLTPDSKSAHAAPVTATFKWTPVARQYGANRKVTVRFTDKSGAVSSRSFVLEFKNYPPLPDPGKDVHVVATSAKGAKVTLNGKKSSDPEGQELTFKWTAGSVKLQGASTATPSGTFPVGRTKVTLEVVDEEGAADKKSMHVVVSP